MEQTGRFGGRASEKAGTRDMPLAMDDWSAQRESGPGSSGYKARDAQGFSELENEYNEGMDAKLQEGDTVKAGRPGTDDYDEGRIISIKGNSALVAWKSGTRTSISLAELTAKDEYRDEAAEEDAKRRGYREDKEQVAVGPTRPERLEFREPVDIADTATGRFGGRGSEKAGARDMDGGPGSGPPPGGGGRNAEALQKAHMERQQKGISFTHHRLPTREHAEKEAAKYSPHYHDVSVVEHRSPSMRPGNVKYGLQVGRMKEQGKDLAMDPLTSKGEEIKSAMEKEYGPKKGESVFYASANKGTIKGVHE